MRIVKCFIDRYDRRKKDGTDEEEFKSLLEAVKGIRLLRALLKIAEDETFSELITARIQQLQAEAKTKK